jgi:UDPglucose 6-dehydrogenase
MKHPVIVDLRNVYRQDELNELGFVYESVGRPKNMK